jgi:CheY-like chemotaxis protein
VWSENLLMPPSACKGPAPRRALVVGDIALGRALIRVVLSQLGYGVTCVASAREGLAALSHTEFSLAMIALQLPDLPGLTLARRLRGSPGATASMPILLFGGAWDAERIQECCREARLQGYLPKPLSFGRLIASVSALGERAPPSPGVAPPMPPSSPIALDRIASFTAGDEQLERELGSLYLATARLYLDEMRAALGSGRSWGQVAHTLKGASANIGAVEMARLAAEAEHADPSAAQLARIEAALEAVRAFFQGDGAAAGSEPETALAARG